MILLAGALMFSACDKSGEKADPRQTVNLSFTSSLPGIGVKTALGDEDAHKSVSWSEGDQIKIVAGSSSVLAPVTPEGMITADVPAALLYGAVYPNLDASLSGRNLTVTIPAEQDGSFASAGVMVAMTNATDRHFGMVNATGIFSFEVDRDDVTSVELCSADGAGIVGKAIYNFADDFSVNSVSPVSTSSVVRVALHGKGTYYVALLSGVKMPSGIGMRYYVGDTALPGVLSTTAIEADPTGILRLGTPDSHIHTGDWFFKADGTGDGSDWNNAAGEDMLRSLLNASGNAAGAGTALGWRLNGATLHLAAGTYDICKEGETPVTLACPDKLSFKILGGYPATSGGTSLDGRAPAANQTVITASSGRILSIRSNTLTLEVDGVEFAGGNSPDEGGAMLCYTEDSNLKFTDCTWRNNTAATQGGAMSIFGGHFQFTNCLFDTNTANVEANYGGAVYSEGEKNFLGFQRCRFTNNKAFVVADVYELGGEAYFNRCVFTGSAVYEKVAGAYLPRCVMGDGSKEAGKLISTVGIHNCTFTDTYSAYATSGGKALVMGRSSHFLVSYSTFIEEAIQMVRAGSDWPNNKVNDFWMIGALMGNTHLSANGINMASGMTQRGGWNVLNTGKNAYATLMDTDNQLGYDAFNFTWNAASQLFTWTLKEGFTMTSYATMDDLNEVMGHFPNFDTWLREMEDDPYSIDQDGNRRNPAKLNPGSWDPTLN